MSEELPPILRDGLALAVARGNRISAWARQHDVPRSTAYRWAKDPELRRQVHELRRRFIDQALGSMASHSKQAVKAILELSQNAKSELVKLQALRSVLRDQLDVSEFADLEQRMNEIEEKLHIRDEMAKSYRSGLS
jgi:hypothetical protein